jgi:hypothetical protein
MNICQGELVLGALCSGMESVWSPCAVIKDGSEFIIFYNPVLLTIPDRVIVPQPLAGTRDVLLGLSLYEAQNLLVKHQNKQ